MESRIHREVYVRFGGEYSKTYHFQRWQGVGCLAYGQIASAKIPLSRMISPQLYWVMSGDD
ncbi:MAG: mobilization protein, partial [Rikenellaceae bacterium]